MGTALVVGLLVVMCGGIAYVGDLLGWRMGKRRLSLFGLRPRHTAVVFTVFTGMLIASVTLGVLMLASTGVRIAVTRGEQLLYDNHRLKQERRLLDGAHAQLVAQKVTLERANADLSTHNAMLRGEEDRLRAATSRLQQNNQALQAKNGALRQHNVRLVTRNTGLLQSNHALTARNIFLSAGNGQLTHANRSLAVTNAGLLTANSRLRSSNRGLLIAKTGLVQARDRAQAQLTKVQGDLVGARNDLTRAQNQLASATRILAAQYALSVRGQELETGKVVVHAGEELARRVLPAGASADLVRGTLQGLLNDADREIARRAGPAPGVVRRVCLDANGRPMEQVPEEAVLALMTESHTVDGETPAGPMPEIHPLVVHALASQNATAESTDPVRVAVVSQVNRLAFHRGEVVTKLTLNTASTSGQLLEQLVACLQHQVPAEAVKRSLLPDASGSVSPIDYESLLDVVAKVKRLPGSVSFGAVAAADTWTAGPLRLDFYVVPAPARVATDHKPE